MNNPVLACQQLSKVYNEGPSQIQVLKLINLSVAPGEMVAIIGASGSGKSTLLHLLGGLDKPSTGEVMIANQSLSQLSEKARCELRNKHLGFIYQFHHLLPEFSALENVSMPLLIGDQEPQLIEERATALLEQVGLKDRLQHRLGQLSGGERQRVAIARALVMQPLCVLADEPTGNLDPKNAERVLEMFYQLQQKHQTSVVMVTHDPQIASKAHRVLRIQDGGLVAA